jgi:hypothetical protein
MRTERIYRVHVTDAPDYHLDGGPPMNRRRYLTLESAKVMAAKWRQHGFEAEVQRSAPINWEDTNA